MLESAVGPTMSKRGSVVLETHHDEKISISLKRRQRMNSSFGRNNKEKTANDTAGSFQQEEEREEQTSRQVHSGTTRNNVEKRHGYHDDTWDLAIESETNCATTDGNLLKTSYARSSSPHQPRVLHPHEATPNSFYEVYGDTQREDVHLYNKTSGPGKQRRARSRTFYRDHDANFDEKKPMQPFYTVVRPIPLRPKKRSTRSNTRKVVTAANTYVFEQLHCCSQSKNAEGKKRREEIRRRSEERARRRYGVPQRMSGTISSERGSRLYYEGMMYKAQVERRVAEKAMELEIQFQTKLNLQQMLEYYFKMQQDEMFQ
eukprot:scaffold10568_cov139-Chaetoceros_neogracile.AAC.1